MDSVELSYLDQANINLTKDIGTLEFCIDKIQILKLLDETQEKKDIPYVINMRQYNDEISKRKHRALKQRMPYMETPYHKDIREKLEDNQRTLLYNNNISKSNQTARVENYEILYDNKVKKKKLSKLNRELNELKEFKKDNEKRIRYNQYALVNSLVCTSENIIDICNTYRNNQNAIRLFNEGYTGYSKCNKNYRSEKCDETMVFNNYTFASCGCGYSTWTIKTPDIYFDIEETTPVGAAEGLSYFM